MKVAEQDVAYVADLANLELNGEERARLQHELNSILDYIDRLNEVDTANVPPMTQVEEAYGKTFENQSADRFSYASRDDIVEGLRKSLPRELALANAPETDGTFFRVPKVIERE
ncbi:MAG: Asp-tRNA(Asn)/Glu-tRNA(Gln) amidotransferase subunit GatC [Acidobacteriaceae bacterium]|nr:Asp-tRNA(Asn)/Glu-tRNA(Gln) amidotransferase subunit GatC [Acidobacteriaceae bacterium]